MDSSSPYYYTADDALQRRGRDPHRRRLPLSLLRLRYQDDYKPLNSNPDLDKLLLLASGLDPDNPDRETLEAIISVGGDALKRDPFSRRSST